MNAIDPGFGGPAYVKRRAVFPKAVDGFYRRLKWAIMAVALTIYWVTPWIRWDRGPYAPNQAVLVDLAHRRFYMFGIEIWPHEFYFVAGLLIMAGIGLFLVTSAVGRAWCGYACPQTVWTDLFQHVERFLDGDRNAQLKLDKAPWGPMKAWKRLRKWAVWLVIAFGTGGAWIFYFADAPTLQREFWSGTAPFVAYASTALLTATTFVFGGFMREQVCIYMCPWPRIQTAMLDEQSLVVTYKHWRGEPRHRGAKKADEAPMGDCIDCTQCVQVCPTGIDIRDGQQLGCITCALCIDACDKVMAQIGKPRGLIDYATQLDTVNEMAGGAPVSAFRRLMHPRTFVYLGVWGGIGLALLFALGVRSHIDLSVAPDRNPLFVQLSDGSIRNSYTLRLRNMESRPRQMAVSIAGLPGAVMWAEGASREGASRTLTTTVPADQTAQLRVYVAAPAQSAADDDDSDEVDFTLSALDREGGSNADEQRFERPGEDE
jgi:cytochrome c oxidase accessory protein FixG